jgi:hypothetical protein
MCGDCEQDKCDFCHEIKVVERTYLKPSKYVKPTVSNDYLKLYNEGDYFIIVKTCNDCGTPNTNQITYGEEEVLNILPKFWMWSTLFTRREHLISWFNNVKKK